MERDDLPDLLPVRMLNEFTYCPRLFYLEWVDRRWMASGDTAEGQFRHRDVDSRGGRVPDAGDSSWPGTTRSVRLENTDLGLVAVVDRIDHQSGAVSPIDYKKGYPRGDDSPWPADRIQVLAQAALLRAGGYTCEEAYLWYAGTARRVAVDVSDETDREVAEAARRARSVAMERVPPAPLVDSPKCPRCSLAPICMPDETNLLLARREALPRRIVPRDLDSRPLYVVEPGSFVGVRGGRLVVTRKDAVLAEERLVDVSQLVVTGSVQVSTQALTRLWGSGVTVLYLSHGGWLNGWSQGAPSKFARLRRRQARLDERASLPLAREIVRGKIRNQRVFLRRNARMGVPEHVLDTLAALAGQTISAMSRSDLMGLEGVGARLYFQHFPRMLREDSLATSFTLSGRNRRPPTDPVNSALSFAYALLAKELVAVCVGVGLDPYLGVLHSDRFGRPSMALDLGEEFRPLIADSVVIQCFNNGELDSERDFFRRAGAVQLTAAGRRSMIAAFERRLAMTIKHPVFGYKISYRRVLDVQARLLAASILEEVDSYVPMVTR